MNPHKAEGPPTLEGPSEDEAVNTPPTITATASTSKDNTDVIRLSRAVPKPPSMIYSEVSIVALVAACDRRLVGGHDVPILVNLLGRASKYAGDWQCWPSIGTVAGEVGCSPSTVYRALGRLERCGYLVRWTRYLSNRQTSNVYRFKLPDYTELPKDNPYHAAPIRAIDDVPVAPVTGEALHGRQGRGVMGATPRGVMGDIQNASKELPLLNSSNEVPLADNGASSPLRGSHLERQRPQPRSRREQIAWLKAEALKEQERSEEEERESNGKQPARTKEAK